MNINTIITDLEAKASVDGLFSCRNVAELDRRIAKWDELMNTLGEEVLAAALTDQEVFDYWLTDPVIDAGLEANYSLNDPQGH